MIAMLCLLDVLMERLYVEAGVPLPTFISQDTLFPVYLDLFLRANISSELWARS
jgi:hypothetical protein